MPYPVPPPEPPAIVVNLPPEASLASECTDVCRVSNRTLVQTALAEPKPPENFPPDYSSVLKSSPQIPQVISDSATSKTDRSTQRREDTESFNNQELTGVGVKYADYATLDPQGKINSDRSQQLPIANLQPTVSQKPEKPTQPGTEGVKEFDFKAVEAQPSTSPQPEDFKVVEPESSTSPQPEEDQKPREFEFKIPQSEPQPVTEPPTKPVAKPATPSPTPSPTGNTIRTNTQNLGDLVEINADKQDYDEKRQIVTAEGNVIMRFQKAVVDADRLQVNLQNRIAVAEGNVALRRGEQVLRGERFEYFFAQDSGTILNATGDLYLPKTGSDFSPTLPTDVGTNVGVSRPLSDRLAVDQPIQNVNSPGGYVFGVGTGNRANNLPSGQTEIGGTVNRLRYKADRVDFDATGWRATNIRITNDPFSPPELELRADTAKVRRISPFEDEITTTRSRVVFDQGLSVPIFQNRRVLDRREQEPPLVNIGFDGDERGGLFIERGFTIISTPAVRLRVTPQYFVQRAAGLGIENPNSDSPVPLSTGIFAASSFGGKAKLDVQFAPRTTLTGRLSITSLEPELIENRTRGSLRLRQVIGRTLPHNLTGEYTYRDRLFNGSLGFQTVHSSIGAVITSPIIPLGKTGLTLSYQAGAQYINADTDRLDLLKADRENNRVNLSRYQASASLNRAFTLWQGKALPATPTEGLRYTPNVVTPYLQVATSITGVASLYSTGESQDSISGAIGLQGQFGHFSRPFLDYTGFNLTYYQVVGAGLSPFLFDRIADNRVLSAGITQQLWGPFRVGFQTSVNLDSTQQFTTDYYVEYSRRTYNVILRYNPVLQLGSIRLRINDFNWLGTPEPFEGSDIRPVVQGVTR